MDNIKSNISDRTKGIICIVISAFGFAMMSAFVKLSGDLPTFQKTFFRNLVSCIVAFIMVIKANESFFGKKENRRILTLRATFGTLGIILNFYAIDKLVLSDANMLNKLSPFFVIIFSALFLKEKIKKNQIIAVVIAFLGALFIIKPELNMQVMPALIGVSGAVCAAIAYTCLRVLGGREKGATIVFYFSLFSLIVIFPFMVISYESMTLIQFTYLMLAGTFATLGQFGITWAYKYAPAKEISIFDYSNIIFSAIISIVLFGVFPDKYSILGYIIIFVASLYMFMYNKKLDKIREN
ncbi:DMT family transporter [Romboutsia lituseburensis]|uniref:Permease of the drug/metabolite transporter (DMT) superfamily n=1 Tax=Romboutsia lituseburensis DSM 797 TaxID=1121325 RepID=A0A1G9M2T3_9FIRM|nr:DMT family transporter [Romboutsia lituseburensis]CEH34654.1 EamA-like transporter protein [Romboutsia lituseburensis]SDL68247.1 Permease of the drug/metabolite transporter (DMT) superfamily [Romboutsia lituseburensis DSM 797]